MRNDSHEQPQGLRRRHDTQPQHAQALVVSPNGLWQLYLFERGTETGNTNDVIDWDSAERIAWAAHDDHELIWPDHD